MAALLVLSSVVHQLSAAPSRASASALASGGAAVVYRGVSLDDLAASSEEEVSPRLDLVASLVKEYVPHQRELALKKILSISLHEFDRLAGRIVVDVLGRDKAYAVVDRDGLGGLGFIRVEIQFQASQANPSDVRILGHKILSSHDWVELSPHLQTSLGDRLAVLEDDETGFRRVFPLGVGSIDAVRFYPSVTVATPTTELARLDKNHTDRRRVKPKYFRGKPFIPLNVPVDFEKDGVTPKHWRTTAIAFHIWQAPKFQRGFLSHGCMRMRGEDLAELLDMVEGVKAFIPVKVRVEKVAEAAHPFPYLSDKFSEIQNFGTKERPRAKREKDDQGVWLTKLRVNHSSPPAVETLTGMTIDPAYGPVPGGAMDHESAGKLIRDTQD